MNSLRPAVVTLALFAPGFPPTFGQCGTVFETFNQSISPSSAPNVAEFAVYDPDGSGPAEAALVIAGNFFDLAGTPISGFAVHDPISDSFAELLDPSGTGNALAKFATGPNGELAFLYQNGFSSYGIEESDGTSWVTIAQVSGGSFGGGGISDVLYLPNGDLVAGGEFSAIGGIVAERAAVWDGTAWSPMDAGLTGSIRTLALDPAGDLIAGITGGPTVSGVSRFDGTSWSPHLVGAQGLARRANDFAFLADGRIAATGVFEFPSSGRFSSVAVWDGLDWTLPGPGIGTFASTFTTAFAVEELPGGDLVVGGTFTNVGSLTARGLARFDGSSWSAPIPSDYSATVQDLRVGPGGDLWIGGEIKLFSSVEGGLARIASNCKATAVNYGAPGTGSGAPIEIDTDDLPWLGTVFDAEVAPLAPGALAFSLLGFQPDAVPLQQLVPEASSNSTLLLVPDLAFFAPLPASGGAASWNLDLPANPNLVGLAVHLQALSVEIQGGASLLVATTDALLLTLGQF